MTGDDGRLAGRRVLVVEDALLIADLISMGLEDCGCTVVGPVPRLSAGLELARDSAVDAASLDVNLAGEYSFPIADILSARGIPFGFLTGYEGFDLPVDYQSCPRLSKPFEIARLIEFVEALLGQRKAL